MRTRSLSRWRRRLALVGVAGLTAVLAPTFAAAPASAAVPFEEADFSAYGHGSLVHLGAVTTPGLQVAKADVAPTSALVDSDGVGNVQNAFGLPISRTKSGGPSNAFANANAAAVGADLLEPATEPEDINLTGLAAADAPPPSSDAEEIDVDLEGLLEIPLLRSFAVANASADGECFLGGPLTAARAEATQAEVLDTVVQGPGVTRIDSDTRFVPQTGPNGEVQGPDFGLASLSQQEIAPINILGQLGSLPDLPDLPVDLPIEDLATVELDLGQFALRTVATGLPGGAYFTYGPVIGDNTGDPVVLSVRLGDVTLLEVTLSQIVGQGGLDTSTLLGGALDPILDIEIGGPPEVTLAADGTFARAVTDIVKFTTLDGALTDLRIGHLEAESRVPTGGVICSLRPEKTANPNPVTVGNNFVYTLTETNREACTLTNVRFIDVIDPDSGVRYEVVGTTPEAASITRADNGNTTVIFNIPDIPPGQTGTAQIVVRVSGGANGQKLTDTLRVEARCAIGSGSGDAVLNVPVSGNVTFVGPTLGGGALARTGEGSGLRIWLAGLGLLSFVVAERIRRRIRIN